MFDKRDIKEILIGMLFWMVILFCLGIYLWVKYV
jgi:hypothetical protein